MAENKVAKVAKDVAAAGGAIVAVLNVAAPVVEVLRDAVDKALENRKQLVTVPDLYSKDFPLTVDQAVVILEARGLRAMPVEVPLTESSPKYRRCAERQVVETRPRANGKIDPNTPVLVKYVTREVIDESQLIFELDAERRERRALEKKQKQEERKERAKQAASDTIDAVRQKLSRSSRASSETIEKEDDYESE